MSYDVIVVGGGPVGLAAALYAARSSLRAVVLEPRSPAVDKACGEGLMPGGVAALADLGLQLEGHPLRGLRYLDGRHLAQADFRHGAGRGVRRTALQTALLRAVERAGVEVVPLRAAGVHDAGSAVVVRTRTGDVAGPQLRGRYVLAADGLHSPIRRALGLGAGTRGPQRYGQRRHYGLAPWSDYVEIHWGPGAEAYVTPVAGDLVGVAVLSSRRAGFEEQLHAFPALRRRLAGAGSLTPVLGAGPLRQRSLRRVSGRTLLVGDSSGYVDALTGEGISLGLAQARAAVSAVAADRPEDYERSWRQVSWRYTSVTEALLLASRPRWARRAIVPAAAALPAVFGAVVRQLERSP